MSLSVVIAQLHIKNVESGGGAIVYVGKHKHFLVWFKLTSLHQLQTLYSLIERWC